MDLIDRTKLPLQVGYVLTDNICMLCKHNPDNYCPIMGCDGNCKKSNKSVIEYHNFNKK